MPRPATVASIDSGSTPEPESASETRSVPPLCTDPVSNLAAGGVVSSTQKRNENGPERAADGVSKTTS